MTPFSQPAKRPPWYLMALESRALYEFGAFTLSYPLLQLAPRGDGHPVMVLPGFMADDLSTLPLRTFLKSKGYAVHGWGLGRNLGRESDPLHVNSLKMAERVQELHQRYGQKVSLVGWSLGGIYARELARDLPEDVRFVITLGSPFTNDIKANNVYRLFEIMSGHTLEELDPEARRKMDEPPPAPSTAIFSRTDGVAAWQCCVEKTTAQSESIEVESSHCGFGHNPLVLWVIADRLAQAEGEWRPFRRNKLKRLLYRNPRRKNWLCF